MTTEALNTLVQQPSTDDIVHLYVLDASVLGGDVFRFVSSTFESASVVWDGETFNPVPVETSGWEVNGRGSLPTPIIRASNVGGAFSAAVIALGDLVGCPFTRIRTFRRFLDGQPDADPDAHHPIDLYRVERKAMHNKIFIEWELSAYFDQEGRRLPGRQVLQSYCTHRYRVWNGFEFDYSKATCPYTGTAYFKQNGQMTTVAAEDRCGKRLGDCGARFNPAPLPTRAFPGVNRGKA